MKEKIYKGSTKTLYQSDEDYALIFHKELKEEEIEMQIELSN